MAHNSLRVTTKVLSGHRVEFTAPELPEGADIDIEIALSGAHDQDETRRRFDALSTRWHNETALLSSITEKAMHPAYQSIIGLGREAVPYILRELKKQPGHWFWALSAITGENPIRPDQQGKMREMASAWVHWGEDHGYLS
jgi:hypothetical protein